MNQLPGWWQFAVLTDADLQEYQLIGAAVVTLVGVWLCWFAPHHRMSVEENAKDGRFTADEARRKIKRFAWAGPVVTFIGLAAVGGILLR